MPPFELNRIRRTTSVPGFASVARGDPGVGCRRRFVWRFGMFRLQMYPGVRYTIQEGYACYPDPPWGSDTVADKQYSGPSRLGIAHVARYFDLRHLRSGSLPFTAIAFWNALVNKDGGVFCVKKKDDPKVVGLSADVSRSTVSGSHFRGRRPCPRRSRATIRFRVGGRRCRS